MKVTLPCDVELEVVDGVISSDNTGALALANALLEGECGRFNNSEVFPDKDYFIAAFLAEEMGGEVFSQRS
jgi:hypothetical protein